MDTPRGPQKTRDMVTFVEEAGYQFERDSGGHKQYKHPVTGGLVTLSGHERELQAGIVARIVRTVAKNEIAKAKLTNGNGNGNAPNTSPERP